MTPRYLPKGDAVVPRDDPCPKRGPGLSHTTAHGTWKCVHCDAVTFDQTDPIAKLRAQYINGETYEDPPKALNADFSALTAEQWHRAVIVRSRVEAGKVTDWPNVVELAEDERRIIGRMGDALIGLFRRVG